MYTWDMKQTMLLKLHPTTEQHQALLDTMHAFNQAATYVAEIAFAEKTANKFELQKLVYGELRTTYKLAAQLAIRSISKASEAYKRDKSIQPTFRPEGAIVYDERVMSFKGLTTVSLLTLSGRVLVPFLIGSYQASRMGSIKGQAGLLYRKGTFSLAVTLDIPTPAPTSTMKLSVLIWVSFIWLPIARVRYSADKRLRRRANAIMPCANACRSGGTKSAKRHLKQLSGKEARFRKNTNHVISKRIVQKAKAKKQAIAIEELRHIRKRTERTVRHSQRARHSSWAFGQLRQFLSYKAALAGVPLHTVDPRNTSRTCHVCGHCAKANRKSQAAFCCVACGYTDNADRNAAINISRASVMVPIVSSGSRSG